MGATATFNEKRTGTVIALQQELMVALSQTRKAISTSATHDLSRDERIALYEQAATPLMKSVGLLTALIDAEVEYSYNRKGG